MSSVWNKIDPGLAEVYADYLRVREHGCERVPHAHPAAAGDGRINVMLHFTATLAEVQALGFEALGHEDEDRAMGTIDLANLEQLAADPGVLLIAFGETPQLQLDHSVPDIRADQVWRLDSTSSGPFSGATGVGAIVGIIDSGIDLWHPFFLRSRVPLTTRIRRIWDQGLVVEGGEGPPDAALLGRGSGTYGVEYTDEQINRVLQSGPGALAIRHRDCDGHGTHVASIAAGDGRPDWQFIGVAPEAELIIVKTQFLTTDPEIDGSPVGPEQLFRDAVSYIRHVARAEPPKPVAINYSIGNDTGPHDGFTDGEDWLTEQFSSATGEAFVTSAGNTAGRREHVRIDFPGTFLIPIVLFDERTNKESWSTCQWLDGMPSLRISIWYPGRERAGPTMLSAPPRLTASLHLTPDPDNPGPFRGPSLGSPPQDHGDVNPVYVYGPAPLLTLSHAELPDHPRGGRAMVHRNYWTADINPQRDGRYTGRHMSGTYWLEVESTVAMTAHVWCRQPAPDFGLRVGRVFDRRLHLEDYNLIGAPGGAANIITVAAYDAESPDLAPASFSSGGPLVDYGGTSLRQPQKPDLAAPGVSIDAASSSDTRVRGIVGARRGRASTRNMQGTSMAAPHVTGAIALMLEANSTLSTAQIRDTLRDSVRRPATPDDHKLGAGRLDVKEAVEQAAAARP